MRSTTDAGASTPVERTRRRPGQRSVDLAVGLVASVATAPLIAVLLVGSAVVFRANPLFVQRRVGLGGKLIPVPKIRTLPPQAPTAADKHELVAVEIPAWGRWLRGLHLDELPQFWSMVAGHMSLVGPRPEMPRLAAQFDPEFAAARTTVRPGITGLWQISEAVSGLIHDAPEYDLAYLQLASGRFDAWVLGRTVRQYLPGGRAVTLDDLPAWVQIEPQQADAYSMTTSGGR
ncbi:MAG: sugar transferase [Acidimicrobiales bacterium]|nr:sugar transferase [Acidimicrobiales bacterium]